MTWCISIAPEMRPVASCRNAGLQIGQSALGKFIVRKVMIDARDPV
jgi:hypothetical protein